MTRPSSVVAAVEYHHCGSHIIIDKPWLGRAVQFHTAPHPFPFPHHAREVVP